MSGILHDQFPDDAIAHPLPGTRPLAPGDWLRRDERYAEQMALRDRLVLQQRDKVIAQTDDAVDAVAELLSVVLEDLGVRGSDYRRADGVTVGIDRDDPLGTLGRLAQEDFIVMLRGENEHWLAAGVLCFPSLWTLTQKIGRPLTAIHTPVPEYDTALATRVQRLFDLVRVEQPLVRWNHLPYETDRLHNPALESTSPEDYHASGPRPFLRKERQVIKRLPETGAVVFSIHTWLVRAQDAG
ncbi:heme-dependent oxidative N-demethylase family protein [Maritimibacter dapengensis]|uniref:DUF3445 domain-containing protein n=1 Tax=Maritimibacter dapengensis TaxID=2836868 RepID=A0ABS6T572_9RHOB|nr:DUF3445 domain-containing protein [Maritimibacter dapengensis]MBV7380379.1 DUF3445 domain-containing protein [Maritimibacter dapengensis]